MNENQNLKKLEQESFRDLMQDGFTELLAGLLFLIFPVLIQRSYFVPIFVVFYIFFLPFFMESIRKRYVYPRIGYVKLKDDEPPKVTAGVVATVIILITGAILVIYAVMTGLITSEVVYRWIPAFLGVIMWAPSLFLVDKTGQKRYYLLGGLMTISGVAVSLVNFLPAEFTTIAFGLIWGLSFLVVGIIRYGLFIRRYPVVESQEDIENGQ
jgi:hypothetical protein